MIKPGSSFVESGLFLGENSLRICFQIIVNLKFILKQRDMFDLSVLPKKAQEELADFYQFLVERYGSNQGVKENTEESRQKAINSFFGQYSLNLSDFTFNRSEIYERQW